MPTPLGSAGVLTAAYSFPLVSSTAMPVSRSPSPEFSTLSIGTDLTPLPTYKAASTTTLNFDSLLSPPLILHEDLSSGCGGQLWPAGMVLAKHMLRYHQADLKAATILEIGAGGGLVGLAVAIGCVVDAPLVISDQENMLALMQRNVELNKLESLVLPIVLNWGEPLPPSIIARPPTHILAADCVYFEPAFPLLLQTLQDLMLLKSTATIFFSFKKRRKADMRFLKSARKVFSVEEVDDLDRSVWERGGVGLWAIRQKSQ